MIRVVIADDSPLIVEILEAVLAKDPEFLVIGHAKDGAEAVEVTKRLRPDLLLMDVHMPVMDGIEATSAIMAEAPVPILVVSGAVAGDASIAYRAIQAGAVDIVEKPSGGANWELARRDLLRHMKLVSRIQPIRRGRVRPVLVEAAPGGEPAAQVIALAASTGGPPALVAVLQALGSRVSCPILAVQHIAPGFLAGFVEWLQSEIPLEVRVAEAGERAEAGRVYFAPEGQHLGLSRGGRLQVTQSPPRDGHRPSASVLFESVADSYGRRAVGVLLTGMGRDGADGLKRLRDAGARTICQDEGTSVVYGMPRAAVEIGAAERVLPLEAIGGAIVVAVARR